MLLLTFYLPNRVGRRWVHVVIDCIIEHISMS